MKNGFKLLFGLLLFFVVLFISSCDNHEHTFEEEYTYNATEHWHKATCEHTDEVKDKEAHSFGEWALVEKPTEVIEGVERRTCTKCGYYEERDVDKLTHEHTFEEEYTANATEHWHKATCEHTDEKKDVAEHTFGDWTQVLAPTIEAEGKDKRTCTVCGYEEERTVEKLSHTHSYSEWNVVTPADCGVEGTKERECSCGAKETATIPALSHDWDEWVLVEPTETENGSYTRICKNKDTHIDTIVLPKISTDNVSSTKVEGKWLLTTVNPSCTLAGSNTYTFVGKGSISNEEKTITFTKVLSALNHDYETEYIYDEETNNVTIKTTCSRCNYEDEETYPNLDQNTSAEGVALIGQYTYFNDEDTIVLEDSSYIVVTGLPTTDRQFIENDKLILVGNYDSSNRVFEMSKLVSIIHPKFSISLDDSSKATVDLNLEATYTNGEAVSFHVTPNNGRIVTSVKVYNVWSEELELSDENDAQGKKYTFNLCGAVKIVVDTESNELNVEQALEKINDLGATGTSSKYTVNPYYVTGVVNTITETRNTDITFNIVNNDSDELVVFRVKFTDSFKTLYVGDTVKVYGYLSAYYKNSSFVPEVASHNSLDVAFVEVVESGAASVTFETDLSTRGITVTDLDSTSKTGHNGDVYKFRVVASSGVISLVKQGDTELTAVDSTSNSDKTYSVILNGDQDITINVSDVQVIPGYRLVKNSEELTTTGKYLLACKEKGLINGAASTDKLLNANVLFVGDDVIDNISSVDYLSLEVATDGWYIKIGEKYINGNSANKNSSGNINKIQFDDEAATVWTISIDASGTALISYENKVSESDDVTWYIKCNNSNGNFTRYSSGQNSIQLLVFDENNEVSNDDIRKVASEKLEGIDALFAKTYSNNATITIDDGIDIEIKSGSTAVTKEGQVITITQQDDDVDAIVILSATYRGIPDTYSAKFKVEKKPEGKLYSYTFVSTDFGYNHDENATTTTKDETLGNITWNWNVTWKTKESANQNFDTSKGVKIGTNALPASSVVLSTSSLNDKKIKSVKVNVCGGSSVNAKINVAVGEKEGTESSITASSADYSYSFDDSGDITITITQISSKALYIKSITILYAE